MQGDVLNPDQFDEDREPLEDASAFDNALNDPSVFNEHAAACVPEDGAVQSPQALNDLLEEALTPGPELADDMPQRLFLSGRRKGGSVKGRKLLKPEDRPANSYNCAGLAFRTYTNMDMKETEGRLAKCTELKEGKNCDDKCKCGMLKCWYWVYDIKADPGYERKDGSKEWSDFHIVCGLVDPEGDPEKEGNDPLCDSKAGPTPLNMGPVKNEQGEYGLGVTGPAKGKDSIFLGKITGRTRTLKPGYPKCYCCDPSKVTGAQ